MKKSLLAVLVISSGITASFAQSAGDIVITEFMANPAAVADASGEWFEIKNVSSNTIDIDGWHIRDSGTNDYILNNGGNAINIQPGDYLLLTNNNDNATNGGLPPGLLYSSFTLGNSGDEIIITDAATTIIDSVSYSSSSSGKSWSLDPGHTNAIDNDDFSNWCLGTTAYGLGDLGTPAAVNPVCSLGTGENPQNQVPVSIHTDHGNLFIHSELSAKHLNWEISSIDGKILMDGRVPDANDFSVPLLTLSPGIYFFRIHSFRTIRFVIN